MKEEGAAAAAAAAAELSAAAEAAAAGVAEVDWSAEGLPANWDLWSAKGSRMGSQVVAAPVMDRMGPHGAPAGKTMGSLLT